MSTGAPGPGMSPENTADDAKLLGQASFSVSSRVAMQLGRESISSSITAVVELVKNAYDADAESIRVRFANLGSDQPFIVIEDDGQGMTIEDLQNHWLVIGTSNKTDKKKTTGKKRVVTGEKGLGRLGLDRLCERTEVESIKHGAAEGFRLDIHWGRYANHAQRLEEVKHDLYSLPNLRRDPVTGTWGEFPTGTRLILRGLKDSWDEDAVAQLKHDLGLLVSPFQGPNDFRIELDTGGVFPQLDGLVSIQTDLLESANWKVEATLDEEGLVEIRMSSPRHETEYHLRPTPWAEVIKRQGTHPHCGPLRMELYFFVRRDAELANRTLKAAEIASFLKFNQGVRIYRDGFRVKPYGEPDGSGDWLRLAYRRMQNPEGVAQDARPGNWRVGYNQVIGAVFISHERNAGLNDQTNREGLLQGKAFDHLFTFALRVVQFFEVHNQTFELARKLTKGTAEKAEDRASEALADANQAIKELSNLASKFPDMAAGPNAPTETSAEIGKVVTEVQRRLEAATLGIEQSTKLFLEAEEQKNTMANLASLGILAASFGHETVNWTGTVVKNVNWLLDNLVRGTFMLQPDVEEEIKLTLDDTAKEASKVRKFARFSLGNLNRDKRQLRDFDLCQTILRVFDAFDEVLRVQRHTRVDLSGVPREECLVSGFEMDWESIVVNLLTNAAWALEDRLASDREIRVTVRPDDADWVMTFEDSGIGLEAGTEHMVFLPAFSTKRSKRGEVIGTGMGLFIVRSFVEDHSGGKIAAIPKGDLGGACFVIRVPQARHKGAA